MSWKQWLILALTVVLSVLISRASADEKKRSPMPQIDSLPGDTSGAITLRDSSLIPTFGIYPATGWGKTTYIDMNTFKQYGLVVFFDPWDKYSRDYVEMLNGVEDKLEKQWGFQTFLVACRKSISSCREIKYKDGSSKWRCQIFLMPDFQGGRNSSDSVKKSLAGLKTSFPIYCLAQPLKLEDEHHYLPALFFAKQKYDLGTSLMPEGLRSYFRNGLVKKMFQKFFFPELGKKMAEWEPQSLKGGDKK